MSGPASTRMLVVSLWTSKAHLWRLFFGLVGSHAPHPALPKAGTPTEVPHPKIVTFKDAIAIMISPFYQKVFWHYLLLCRQARSS